MSHLCEQMARGELVHGDSAAASRKMSFNSFSSSSVTHLIVSLVKLPCNYWFVCLLIQRGICSSGSWCTNSSVHPFFFFFTLGGSPVTDAQIWIFSMLVSLVSTIFEVGFGKFSLSPKDFFTWTEADIWPFCWFSSMVELPLWDQNNLEMISLLGYWRVRILTLLKLSSIWF